MANAEYRLHLTPRTANDPDAAVASALTNAKAAFGMIPNMYANMANAPSLLETYMLGYAGFRRDGGFSAAEQEVVFLTISIANGCSYCVGAHSAVADMADVPTEVTDALRAGDELTDEHLAALAAFTRTMVLSRGLPTVADVDAFLAAGFTETHVLYIVLAIAVKTLSNYSNHLFHTPLDRAFAARAWEG
ncbi:MAG: carboxymuconolactone decarboxylase family protein [Acidimicrobiia bacterium]